MIRFVFLFVGINLVCTLFAQTELEKSVTISVKKEEHSLTGLYRKIVVYDNKSIIEAASLKNVRPDRQHSEVYFYFLPNGMIYQIESKQSARAILQEIKTDPAKLRPVLASYGLKDSILVITPFQESLTRELEPTSAYFEGMVSGDQLFLTKKNTLSVTVFRRVDEERRK